MVFKGRNVLNVIPCQWMEHYLPKQTPGITMHNLFDDSYPHLRSLNYAREHNIDVTIASHDRASMIQAAVNDALGLPGISLAAQFYCNNKYYGRTIEDNPIWYSYIDPDESDEENLARVTRHPVIVERDRSHMNVVFSAGSETQDARFVDACTADGIVGVAGHRSRKRLRVSLYNAVTLGEVDAFVAAMARLEKDRQ